MYLGPGTVQSVPVLVRDNTRLVVFRIEDEIREKRINAGEYCRLGVGTSKPPERVPGRAEARGRWRGSARGSARGEKQISPPGGQKDQGETDESRSGAVRALALACATASTGWVRWRWCSHASGRALRRVCRWRTPCPSARTHAVPISTRSGDVPRSMLRGRRSWRAGADVQGEEVAV